MWRLGRPGAENDADQGKNERNWLGKACSIVSGVFGGVIQRLRCYSSAGGSKNTRANAHSCIEGVRDEEKRDDLERTGLALGELIYGRGRTGCLEDSIQSFAFGTGSVLPVPLSLKDLADAECRESRERRGVKPGPYGQMVLNKWHHRAILRLSTIFKKNPGMKLLDVKVRKSNGNSVNMGAEKGWTAGTPQSTITAKAVAWVKSHCAREKMKVKTTCYKVSNPIKEEEGNEEEEDDIIDDKVDILKNEEEEGGEMELCKKRILMGRRCKPLNCSGALQYDKNGILLPELLP